MKRPAARPAVPVGPPAVLDVPAAALFLGITPKAVRARVERRLLPYRRLGGRIVFVRGELEAFLAALDGCSVEEALTNAEARR